MLTTQLRYSSSKFFPVSICLVLAQAMVESHDPISNYTVEPYGSLIVNCWYGTKLFPLLLSYQQLHDLLPKRCPFVGIVDLRCDLGGPIELVRRTTSFSFPLFRCDAPRTMCGDRHAPSGLGDLEPGHWQIPNQIYESELQDNHVNLVDFRRLCLWVCPIPYHDSFNWHIAGVNINEDIQQGHFDWSIF